MVPKCHDGYDLQWAVLSSIAPKIGCTLEALRIWLRQYERNASGGDGVGCTGAGRRCGLVGLRNHLSQGVKGSQYVSLAYMQRRQDAELLPSTGSTGDSYDNALAESINGLYKAEVIHRQSWKNRTKIELSMLAWVDRYNNRRLLKRLGYIPPVEAEKRIILP
jgi:putative transposase